MRARTRGIPAAAIRDGTCVIGGVRQKELVVGGRRIFDAAFGLVFW
jgi:hypothetical protein